MKKTIFFDLDGTIIDVKKRHLTVFQKVISDLSMPHVDSDVYWQSKQVHRLPWRDISEQQQKDFNEQFKYYSEEQSLLAVDTLIPDIIPFLIKVKQQASLVLVTQRHNPDNLHQQLEDLQIRSIFTAVLTPHPETKQLSIKKYGFNPQDFIIGDTEEDILTAQELSLSSVAVTWGLRSKEFLLKYQPTTVVDSIEGLQKLFLW